MADWPGIGRLAWDWLIGTGLAQIGTDFCLSNWPQIGTGLASIGMDWHGLANLRICVGTKNWPLIGPDWIGTGLARIGMDWKIGKFLSQRKIGPRLAQDWHGLARIGTDRHGLARIGTDWHGLARIDMDWHGLAWIDMDWHGLARIG